MPRAEISSPERPAHLPSPLRANERGLLIKFYREIRTLERPLMSPVRANERGSFVELFYRATCRNQHLGAARSFASMIRANERFFQFCIRNQLSGEGPLICPQWRGQMSGVCLFGQLLLCHGQKISTPERPAHLPSPVRAGFVCSVFLVPWAEISTPERVAYLPSPVRANERGLFVDIFLPCHGQKSARRRGPLIGVNGEGKWAGSLCSVFTVPRAEISSPQRPAHLPSPVRAKERGACAVFTAPRAEISSPERAAHLPSMARANERSPFGQLLLCHGQKIIGLHR